MNPGELDRRDRRTVPYRDYEHVVAENAELRRLLGVYSSHCREMLHALNGIDAKLQKIVGGEVVVSVHTSR